MTRDRQLLAVLLAVVVAGGALTFLLWPDRQAEVAARGSQVMPFDLDLTTHRFAKNASGGVQTVTAKDPTDTDQIRLIREHLIAESARFSRGDFGDPAKIHGDEMPGLAELSKGFQSFEVGYAELPDGARLTYTTDDKTLATALQAWFDAQVSDHGEHAQHG